MFKWLLKNYRDYKMKNHISKQSCFVFPILPKEKLIDGRYYDTFRFVKKRIGLSSDTWEYNIEIIDAVWNKEKDCFINFSKIINYDDFKPIKLHYQKDMDIDYRILSYNPCTVNELDLEELKNITYNVGDDTSVESDDIWNQLIDYFDKRGLNE